MDLCPEALLKHPVSIYYNPSLFPPSFESPYLTTVNSPESWGVWTEFNGLQAGLAVLKIRKIKYLIETEPIGSGSCGRERNNIISLLAWGCLRVCLLGCASDTRLELLLMVPGTARVVRCNSQRSSCE